MLQSVADNRENALLNQIEARSNDNERLRQRNAKLCSEVAGLEAQRDRFRNSLGERAEECAMLRKSNADLAGRVVDLMECQKDSRRLDWLGGLIDTQNCDSGLVRVTVGFAFRGGHVILYNLRQAADSAMEEAEEKRQDRISELRAELAKLCREGEEE